MSFEHGQPGACSLAVRLFRRMIFFFLRYSVSLHSSYLSHKTSTPAFAANQPLSIPQLLLTIVVINLKFPITKHSFSYKRDLIDTYIESRFLRESLLHLLGTCLLILKQSTNNIKSHFSQSSK